MVLDIEKIRSDFPIFERKVNGKPIIYFDNAATSQKPRIVIDAIKEFYEKHNANVHRGIHILSEEASEMYEDAHSIVAKFIGAQSMEEVIFVRNTTEALNFVAMTYGMKYVDAEDEIVVTIMEHHSNMLPWVRLAEMKKAKLRVVDITSEHELDYSMLENVLSEKTKIVAVTQASNVLGTINDIKRICKIAKQYDSIVVVDGAQSAPHMPIDVKDLGCDFFAFSGHKMLGPTGIGVLYGKKEILEDIPPALLGGGMISSVSFKNNKFDILWAELPWKFEAGTPNIAGAIGLSKAIEYLKNIGMKNIFIHEQELTRYTLRRIEEEPMDSIETYGPKPESRVGIVAFNIKGLDPHAVALYLDQHGIAVRSGFHCAQPLHERLGLKKGSVRASFYFYNTKEEVDIFVDTLRKISKKKQ